MFEWIITNLKRIDETGSVVTASWRCVYTIDNETAESSGDVRLNQNEIDENFISYADLTESVILNWVYEIVHKDSIESMLEQVVIERNMPETIEGLPWGSL